MIIAVSGIVKTGYNQNNNSQYKQKYYQTLNRTVLKEQIKNDFGEMLSCEMSKLKINILI